MANKLNMDRFMKTLSDILSEKHGCKVTMTATPKEPTQTIVKEECKCT